MSDEAEYQFAKKKYDEMAETVGAKLTADKAKKAELDSVLSTDKEWLKKMHSVENATDLSLIALVEKKMH